MTARIAATVINQRGEANGAVRAHTVAGTRSNRLIECSNMIDCDVGILTWCYSAWLNIC
jgi:hypothetical protein